MDLIRLLEVLVLGLLRYRIHTHFPGGILLEMIRRLGVMILEVERDIMIPGHLLEIILLPETIHLEEESNILIPGLGLHTKDLLPGGVIALHDQRIQGHLGPVPVQFMGMDKDMVYHVLIKKYT